MAFIHMSPVCDEGFFWVSMKCKCSPVWCPVLKNLTFQVLFLKPLKFVSLVFLKPVSWLLEVMFVSFSKISSCIYRVNYISEKLRIFYLDWLPRGGSKGTKFFSSMVIFFFFFNFCVRSRGRMWKKYCDACRMSVILLISGGGDSL